MVELRLPPMRTVQTDDWFLEEEKPLLVLHDCSDQSHVETLRKSARRTVFMLCNFSYESISVLDDQPLTFIFVHAGSISDFWTLSSGF